MKLKLLCYRVFVILGVADFTLRSQDGESSHSRVLNMCSQGVTDGRVNSIVQDPDCDVHSSKMSSEISLRVAEHGFAFWVQCWKAFCSLSILYSSNFIYNIILLCVTSKIPSIFIALFFEYCV